MYKFNYMKNGEKNTKTRKVQTQKEKLIEAAKKKGGIEANRKALEDMQEFVSKEMKGLDMQKIRETAWK